MPWAAFPEAVGGLPAAEICAGRSLYGATPRAVLRAAASASLGGEGVVSEMQVPRSHPGPPKGCGICASDAHYSFGTTTLENPL